MLGYVFATFTSVDELLPFRVTIAGVSQNQPKIVRVDGWTNYQWIQCTKGVGELNIDGEKFIIRPGQGVLLFPEARHEYHSLEEPWIMDWISFNGPLVKETLNGIHFSQSQVLNISKPDVTLKKISDIYETLLTNSAMANIHCSALLYSLLLDIFYLSARSNASSKQQKYDQLLPALSYIEEHYGEIITLADISTTLGVSQQYTCHLFRQAVGIRPFDFVNRVRTRNAKELLLKHPDASIKSVAEQVGYDNIGYFIKTFKKLEGIPPSEFRKRYRGTSPAFVPYEDLPIGSPLKSDRSDKLDRPDRSDRVDKLE